MKNKSIYLILLYNQKIKTTNAYKSLKEEEIIVFDNSDNVKYNNYNYKYCRENNIVYLTNNYNVGNAKAYNQAFNYINKHCQYDYVILADSDTIFSDEYKSIVSNLDKTNKFYLPLIRSSYLDEVVFPIQKTKDRVVVGNNKVDNITKLETINSGLVLSKVIASNNKYDEKFFVYCCDFEFVNRIKDKYDYEILDVEINQEFFDHSNKFSNNTIKQMAIRLSDEKKYLSKKDYLKFRNNFIWSKFLTFKKFRILTLLFRRF